MSCNLSDLVDNLSRIYNVECKLCMKKKKIRSDCEFIGFKRDRLNYKCKKCGEKRTKLKKETIKNVRIMHQFCNGDPNKLFLLLRKSPHPYEDMDSWEKFEETTIPPKEAFYSKLNVEGISDSDYEFVQKRWELFKIKNRSIMTCIFSVIHYYLQMCLKYL